MTESLCSLTLEQAVAAIEYICAGRHKGNCERCKRLIKTCNKLSEDGVCALGDLHRYATSSSHYDSEKAKRLILQLPVAILSSGCAVSGVDICSYM